MKNNIVIVLLCALCVFLFIDGRKETKTVEYVEVRDTVVVYEYDTDTVFVNNVEYITRTVNDTVWIVDEPKRYTFNERNYTLDVEAVRLGSYRLQIHADTVLRFKNVYKHEKVTERKRFTHGLQLGVGYGVFNNKPDVFIGYGIQINF